MICRLVVVVCLAQAIVLVDSLALDSEADYALKCRTQRVNVSWSGRHYQSDELWCEDTVTIEQHPNTRFLEFSLVGRERKCSNRTFRVSVNPQQQGSVEEEKIFVGGENGCRAAIKQQGGRFLISPIGTGVCCHNMRLLMCTSVYKDHTLGQTHHSRRWLPTHKKQTLYHHEQGMAVTGVYAGLVFAGLIIVITIAALTSIIGCCLSKSSSSDVDPEKPPILEQDRSSFVKSTSLSSSCEKYKESMLDQPVYPCSSPSISRVSLQSSTSPPLIGSYCTKTSSYISDAGIDAARHFLANRELPKPQEAEAKTEPEGTDAPQPSSGEVSQHIYFKLEGMHIPGDDSSQELLQEDEDDEESQEETNLDIRPRDTQVTPKTRKYFVLEVKENEPHDSGSTGDVTVANKQYHIFEPIRTDEPQVCSICNQFIHKTQESIYLVILPDEDSKMGPTHHPNPLVQTSKPPPLPTSPPPYLSSDTVENSESQEDVPVSNVGEQREETDPLLEDQGNAGADDQDVASGSKPAERIYYSLEVPPAVICMQCVCSTEEEPVYTEVDEPLPDPIYEKIRLHARQDTTTSHTSSHTYASVPSLEHNNTQTTAGEEKPSDPPKSLALRELREPSEDYASIPSSPIYSQPTLKPAADIRDVVCSLRNKMRQLRNVHRSRSSSPTHDTPSSPPPPAPQDKPQYLTHEDSCEADRPFVVAQRKRTGSYLMLNLDSIWHHQQEHHYAPVALLPPTSSTKETSHVGRESSRRMLEHYFQQQKQQQQHPALVSDYEVPVSCLVQAKVPPPLMLQRLVRQPAIDRQQKMKSSPGKLFRPTYSEPCLSIEREESCELDQEECLSSAHSTSSVSGDHHSVKIRISPHELPSPNKSPLKRMSYPFL